MSAAVLSGGSKRAQKFRPAIVSLEPQPSLTVTSEDFIEVETVSSSPIAIHVERPGLLHRLRYYVGAALAGSVLSGLAFGWIGHRELIQIIGAVAGLLAYAVTPHHDE
jgi:hypothetical protein